MSRCEFIQEQEGEHAVKLLCEVMGIGRSGYYAWKQRMPGERVMEDRLMKSLIQPIFTESKHTYGSRRIKASLIKAGVNASRRRICRLMKEEEMVPKQVSNWHPQTTQANEKHEKAPNLLWIRTSTQNNPIKNGRWISRTSLRKKVGFIWQ